MQRRRRLAGRRTSYWNEVYTSHFAQVSFDPVSRDNFEAELRTGTLGPLELARVSYNAADVERTRSHIERTRARMFSFVLHLRGRGVFTHCGHEIVLDAGDFTLSDNAEPHHLRLQGPADVIIVRAPKEVLKPYLPSPERLCGLRLPAREGFTSASRSARDSSPALSGEDGPSPRLPSPVDSTVPRTSPACSASSTE